MNFLMEAKMNNQQIRKISKIEYLGLAKDYVYDVGMKDTPHTFFANGILVHNSSFISYDKIFQQRGIQCKSQSTEQMIQHCLGLDQEVKAVIDQSTNEISNTINCENMFFFESEEIYDKLLITSKKKYIARKIYDKVTKSKVEPSEYNIKGMEFKKSNLSAKFKIYLQKLTENLMSGMSEADTITYLREMFYEMSKLSIDDISFAQTVKNLHRYEASTRIAFSKDQKFLTYYQMADRCPYHVKGAIIMNRLIDEIPSLRHMTKVREGTKGKIVFVCRNNIFQCTAITLAEKEEWTPELEKYFRKDVCYAFDRTILSPMKNIFKTLKFRINPDRILGYGIVDPETMTKQLKMFVD
jgi:hypothetical protein